MISKISWISPKKIKNEKKWFANEAHAKSALNFKKNTENISSLHQFCELFNNFTVKPGKWMKIILQEATWLRVSAIDIAMF